MELEPAKFTTFHLAMSNESSPKLISEYGFLRVLYYMFGPFLCSICNNLFSDDNLFDIATTVHLICNVKFYYALPIYCNHFAPLMARLLQV